jgi:hypothetical protein
MIITRAGKGAPLTNAELDANFIELRDKEHLAPIAQQLHKGAAVDVFLYDTAKDSDGGAWRNRCKHTSWENEELVPGKWLGLLAEPWANSFAAAGGQVGDYFQLSNGNFYQLINGNTFATVEVFRGNTREFPALAAIVAEAGRVVVYDATKPELPMWMVFVGLQVGVPQALSNGALSSVTAINGKLLVGLSGPAGGVAIFDYLTDRGERINATTLRYNGSTIADRHISRPDTATGSGQPLASSTVNDIAATVLPDAPIDPATGLPVPTVAVATHGGISIIKHDGVVVRSSETSISAGITFAGNSLLRLYGDALCPVNYPDYLSETFVQSAQYDRAANYPAPIAGALNTVVSAGGKYALGGAGGLTVFKENPAAPRKSMAAHISNAYNSGWQVGDSRGAWLADTAAESIQDGQELVTNGGFGAGTANWIASAGATLSINAGRLVVTQGSANNFGQAQQTIPLVVGKTYEFNYEVSDGSTTQGIVQIGGIDFDWHSAGKYKRVFTATAANMTILLALPSTAAVGSTGIFDNISIKPLLVTNGTFDSGITGWTAADSGTGSSRWNAAGYMELTGADSNNRGARRQVINGLTVGRQYVLNIEKVAETATAFVQLKISGNGLDVFPLPMGKSSFTFGPVLTTSVTLEVNIYSNGTAGIDNISIKPAESDRSVKNKALTINGTIAKTPVAAGAQLVAYSGFTTANYLEQSYNPDLDFGAGDFCIMGWGSAGGVVTNLYNRADPGGTASNRFLVQWANNLTIYGGVGSYAMVLDAQNAIPSGGGMCFVAVVRRSGVLEAWVNGTRVASTPFTQDLSNNLATLRIGGAHAGVGMGVGSLALVRASSTAPAPDQIAQIYRDELALFQPGAQCTIAGNPGQTVNTLAYDETTDLLHVGTDFAYRSAFKGLLRVESEWVSAGVTGPVLALSASGGTVLTGCGAATHYRQPAMLLRDELRRRAEARRAMAREEIPLDFDGIAAQTLFPLPIGFTAKGVFVAGQKKRKGATKDYTVTFDGYRETVVFGVSPGATWVQVTANRSI